MGLTRTPSQMMHIKLLFKGCVKSSTSTILSKEVFAMVKKLCGVKHLNIAMADPLKPSPPATPPTTNLGLKKQKQEQIKK